MIENKENYNDQTQSAVKHKVPPTSLLSNRGILVILSSNSFGKTFIINRMSTIIGRSYDCEFIINDPMVSKKHCQILFEDDNKFYIEDIGSKNSTYLNEKEVKKKEHIIYGDRIVIGNTIMRFYLEEKLG